MYHKNTSEFHIYGMAIMLRYLQYFITNMYAIALPLIIIALTSNSINSTTIKLTVSAYFLGLTSMMFFSGILIEKIGGKRVVFLSLSLIILGSIICIYREGIVWLFIGRVFQSMGAGSLPTISKIILSFSDKRKMAKAFSITRLFIVWSDSLGFLIAGYLLYFFHWKSVFMFLLVITILFFAYSFYFFNQHENAGQYGVPLKKYMLFLTHYRLMATILAYGLYYALINVYYVQSALVFSQGFHLQPHTIAWLMVAVVIPQALAVLLCLILIRKDYSKITLEAGLLISLVGAVMLFILKFNTPSVASITLSAAIFLFGTGFAYAEFNSLAINMFRQESVAISASLLSSFPPLMTFIITGILAVTEHRYINSLSITMLICTLLSIILCLYTLRK